MWKKKCPTPEQLKAYTFGQLSIEDIDKLTDHLADCPPCEETLANLDGDGDTLLKSLRQKSVGTFAENDALLRAVSFVKRIGQSASTDSKRSDEPPPLGQLREYELLEKLGEGGMGAVYKARHSKLDKIVAIKILPAEKMRDIQAVARFEREMRAVGKLDHPNIVRAMDAGEVDGLHFLVMEYVEGLDLSKISKQCGPLPIADACELIRQAAIGLEEAEANQMVHRDIKPSNLILTQRRREEPVVKILDMGLAQLSDAHASDGEGLTTTGQMMGTLDYMAPEQGGDSKSVDIRADIYALGVSLYRLLCGKVIYHGKRYATPVQKMMALATKPAPSIQSRRDGIPDELAAIVHKMLEKNPDDRFATPREVADALEPFCRGAELGRLLESDPLPIREFDPPSTSTTTAASDQKNDAELSIEAPRDPTLTPQRPNVFSGPRTNTVTTGTGQATAIASDEGTIEYAARGGSNRSTVVANASSRTPSPLQVNTDRSIPITPIYWIGGALAGCFIVWAAVVLFIQTPKGTLRVEIDDPGIQVKLQDDDHLLTFTFKDRDPVKLRADDHNLIVSHGNLQFTTDQFNLTKNGITTVKVQLLPDKIQVVSAGKVIGEQTLEDWTPHVAVDPRNTVDAGSRSPQLPSVAGPWRPTPEQQRFLDAVAQLPETNRAETVARKMQEIAHGPLEIDFATLPDLHLSSQFCNQIWPLVAIDGIRRINFSGSGVVDFRPLQAMRVVSIELELPVYNPQADAVLSGLLTLQTINQIPKREYLAKRAATRDKIDTFAKLAPNLGTTEIIEWIKPLLDELNPPAGSVDLKAVSATDHNLIGYTRDDDGYFLNARMCGRLRDLSPLRVLPFTRLSLSSTRVVDLSPLQGLPIKQIEIIRSAMSDLSPLSEMPLEDLSITFCGVSDLRPLAGLELQSFYCFGCPVSDLSPLAGMPLTRLTIREAPVDDLTPLAGMKLQSLDCSGTPVTDISVLQGMPISSLDIRKAKPVTMVTGSRGGATWPRTVQSLKGCP